MRDNKDILAERSKAFDAHPGPRVGDYVYVPADDTHAEYYTRITHDWGDQVQTGGHEHSQFYFHESGTLDYSGGLDSGVMTADLIATEEKKKGSAWFFDGNIRGAGRGVDFQISMRVFRVKDGANIEGMYYRKSHAEKGEAQP